MYNAPYQGVANDLAKYGRYGDSMLVHMNPIEVQMLASLSPTGRLTTNPMTGQQEAFLPFLAPLLGSFLGQAALPTIIPALAGKTALAGAIGSGLATTAVTGDLEQGIMSGITGFGIGSALGASAGAGNEIVKQATTDLATKQAAQTALSEQTTKALTEAQLREAASNAALSTQGTMAANAPMIPGFTDQIAGAPEMLGNIPSITPALQNPNYLSALSAQNVGAQGVTEAQKALATAQANIPVTERLTSPFREPGAFFSNLTEPSSFLPMYVGETGRMAREQELMGRGSMRAYEEEQEKERQKTLGQIGDVYSRIRSAYPGVGYAQGGYVERYFDGGYMEDVARQYADATSSIPVARDVQLSLRGSQFVPPPRASYSALDVGGEGYLPGVADEFQYFREPVFTNPVQPSGPTPGQPGGNLPPGGGGVPGGNVAGGGLDLSNLFSNFGGYGGYSNLTNLLNLYGGGPQGGANTTTSTGGGKPATGGTGTTGGIRDFEYFEPGIRGGMVISKPTTGEEWDRIKSAIGRDPSIPRPGSPIGGTTTGITKGTSEPNPETEIANRFYNDLINSGASTQIARDETRRRFSSFTGPAETTINSNGGGGSVTTGGTTIDANNYQDFTGGGYQDFTGGSDFINQYLQNMQTAAPQQPAPTTPQPAAPAPSQPAMDQFNDLYNLPEFSMRDYMESQREFTGDMGNVPVTPQATQVQPPQAPVYADNVDPNFFNRVPEQAPTIDYDGMNPSIINQQTSQNAFDAAMTKWNQDVENTVSNLMDANPGRSYQEIYSVVTDPKRNMVPKPDPLEYGVSNPIPYQESSYDFNAPLEEFGGDFSNQRSFEDYAFQEGGQIPSTEQMGNDLVQMTVAAIRGEVENADQIIQAFVEQYGPEVFMQLREQVLQDIVPGAQTQGMVEGMGGGQDDMVNGMIGSQRPVAVSPGEYIIPADVVSLAGGGYSGDGASFFDSLVDDIRQKTMGTKEQIRPYRSA
jgi:hypothetical protein